MARRGLVWAVLGGVLALASHALAAAPRAEVPIKEVVLSDGTRRYAITVTVGATPIEAGVDTGSTGLRILPNTLGPTDARAGSRTAPYAYGSGVKLDGISAQATVAIGAASAPIEVELVEHVGCTEAKPRCPATRVSAADYGIQGDGLPKEGFKAIIGINMARADAETPLRALGARRWIVELPRPGEGVPGRLILNPTDDEAAGYAPLKIIAAFRDQHGGLHDAVPGCLVNRATQKRACGAVLLDSGAPGLGLANGGLGGQPWPENTPGLLVFADEHGHAVAGESFTVGLRAHASHLGFSEDAHVPGTVIYAGLMPYFAFSVLYDPEAGAVALKPRPPAPGGPQGELAPAHP